MTEEERNANVIDKLNRLKYLREEYALRADNIRVFGEQLERIGRNLKAALDSLRVSKDGRLSIAPHREHLISVADFQAIPDSIVKIAALRDEIDRIKLCLSDAGYGSFVKDM